MFNNIYRIIYLILFVGLSITIYGLDKYDVNNPHFQKLEKAFLCTDGCGMALEDCSNKTAEQMRIELIDFLDKGLSDIEIKTYMINIYGNEVLREPPKTGFNLIVWISPFIAILIGFVVVFLAVNKWTFYLKIQRKDEKMSRRQKEDIKMYSSLIDEERKKYF